MPIEKVLGDQVLVCKLPPGFGLFDAGPAAGSDALYVQVQFRKYSYRELAPYAVAVMKDVDPPMSCKDDVWMRSGCGIGGRFDHTPFVKSADGNYWLNVDTHYELKFE